MAFEHLMLSDEVGPWPAIGREFLKLAAGEGAQLEELDKGALRAQLGPVLVSVARIGGRSASIWEERAGFLPTLSITLRAAWEQTLAAEMLILGIAARYVRSHRASRVGIYRNFEDDFLVQKGTELVVIGVNAAMHNHLLEELGPSGEFSVRVDRWLGLTP